MSDLKQINEFREEFMGKHYQPLKNHDIERIENQKNVSLLRYIDGNDLIAFAIVSFVETLTRKVLRIEDLIVEKEHRNKGIGKQFLKEVLIPFAESHKVDCIEVNTKKENKIAQKLYERFNFKNRGQIAYRLWLR